MKKRYLYSLLFGIPGFFMAGIISLVAFGFVVGALWLFVFGDNPWPASTETILPSLLVLVFLTLWIGSIILGFVVGKRLEKDPALNKSHILLSAGLTLTLVLFIVFQQWSVGNLGPKSPDALCMDYCRQSGYSASSTSPRDAGAGSCSCYDNGGDGVLIVPLDSIDPGTSK